VLEKLDAESFEASQLEKAFVSGAEK
jgi:hypothetical protein